MTVREFNEKIANYINTQREYSRRLAANEPAEKLADLKATLDDMAATFNFFDAHGNALSGEDLVKHVDGMQDEYARTLDINSPFIFVSTNGKTPKVFAMNAKSTGAGSIGKVELSLDPKPLNEDYYNEKYRPDDLKVFEKPQAPGFFARVYNWFHKQFNDGLESDTFREYNKAVHKYEKMHHFHTREIQPKNNGKMNWEMDDVPEMPDRTKMSEAEYEQALKAYNDYHEFTPKPKEYYENGISEILEKLGVVQEREGEELEAEALEAIVDEEAEMMLDEDEEIIDETPSVEQRDRDRIEKRINKLGESFYEKPAEEWSFQERENLRDFKEGMLALYARDDFGKNMVMNASDELLEMLYDLYQEDFALEWKGKPVENLFEQAQKQLNEGKDLEDMEFDVPDHGEPTNEEEPKVELQENPVYW